MENRFREGDKIEVVSFEQYTKVEQSENWFAAETGCRIKIGDVFTFTNYSGKNNNWLNTKELFYSHPSAKFKLYEEPKVIVVNPTVIPKSKLPEFPVEGFDFDEVLTQKEEYLRFHEAVCNQLITITAKKNADYTGSNDNPFANFTSVENGICSTEQGFLVRMNDKFERIKSFVSQGDLQVKEESVSDTLMDLANYCILMMGYLNQKKNGIGK